jgi:hypothetical protein
MYTQRIKIMNKFRNYENQHKTIRGKETVN